MFLWRHRGKLAALYLLVVSAMAAFLWYYPRQMPHGIDLGLTIALRSWLHQGTFDEVERAREEFLREDLGSAEARLEAFLDEHAETQAGQMYTEAATQAHELLAQVYAARGKNGRAVKTLERALDRTPLHWRLWERLGNQLEEQGDLADAAEAYREAFKLTLDHPRVTKAYLGVLAEMGRHEDVLWVIDHFDRASPRTAPVVEAKAGRPRSSLQQKGLDFAGIPVEHGDYGAALRRYGLERGEGSRLSLPGELFVGLPADPEEIYLQLEFHNVYDELTIDSLLCVGKNGEKQTLFLEDEQVKSLHREESGSDYHVEMRFRRPVFELEELTVEYSCPEHRLGNSALSIVRNARRNLAAREAR